MFNKFHYIREKQGCIKHLLETFEENLQTFQAAANMLETFYWTLLLVNSF